MQKEPEIAPYSLILKVCLRSGAANSHIIARLQAHNIIDSAEFFFLTNYWVPCSKTADQCIL